MDWAFRSPKDRAASVRPGLPPLLLLVALLPILTILSLSRPVAAQDLPVATADLPAELRSREAQLVQLVNAERRKAGLLPLRWNRELSEAAAWFARDTADRPVPNCGHQDTLGRGSGERMRAFGYTNPSLAGEVVVCGFTEPVAAVAAWMYGGIQRDILLNPDAREVGAGYYFNPDTQRGYVALDISLDDSFAPAIINDEAVLAGSPSVRLTIYPHRAPLSPAVQMKIANEPTFESAAWEPFAAEKQWTLEGGTGWRTVHVLTRDGLGRTRLLTDTIFLGDSVPKEQISLDQATNIGSAFAISALPAAASGAIRLSLGWQLDNPAFPVYRGPNLVIGDPAAVGGSALLLVGDEQESIARAESYELPVDRMLTAYLRLKVSDNQGDAPVARITIKADGQSFGPLLLRGRDFASADRYQEFPLNFAFPQNPGSALAEVEIARVGSADVTLDVVRFFGQPMPTSGPIVWSAGGGAVRSRGVWARAESASGESALFDVSFAPVDNARKVAGQSPRLAATPSRIVFKADSAGLVSPPNAAVVVCSMGCDAIDWRASSGTPWLSLQPSAEGLILTANAAGLKRGVYYGTIFIVPEAQTGAAGSPDAAALVLTYAAVEFWVDGALPLQEPELISRTWLPMAFGP